VYVGLSPLAKIAAAVAGVGIALVVYHRLAGATWAHLAGTVLFFAGVAVYFFERIRMVLRARRDGGTRPPG